MDWLRQIPVKNPELPVFLAIGVGYAFIKKSQETPDRELKLARKRLKELQDG